MLNNTFKKIIIDIGLRCAGIGVSYVSVTYVLFNIEPDNLKPFVKTIFLGGSACMLTCGTLAFCIKPNYALMMRLAGTGILLHTLGLLFIRF